MSEQSSKQSTASSQAGAVDITKTVKAGCGIRYDPEILGDDSGFDFSGAEKLKPVLSELSEPED